MGRLLLALCFHFLFFHFPCHCSSMEPLCNLEQASALLQLKSSFTLNSSASDDCVGSQSSYPKTKSWKNGTNCCLWEGVTCDAMSGHVIGLDLSCSWLEGKFHLNTTIFQLAHLQTLNFAHNNFSGEIPFISNFQNLTSLDLSYNSLSGQISSSFSNVQNLTSLDLSYNSLSGQIPSSFSNLQNLISLDLSGNNLSGQIPSSLSNLQNLMYLYLADNSLSGQIPSSLSNLQNLIYLDLLDNSLSEKIPNLQNLILLDLSNNSLSGQISSSFSNFQNLMYLYLSHNNFSGQILPSLSTLQYLTDLALVGNNFNGEVPESIFGLANLQRLQLSSNNFSGFLNFHQFLKLQNMVFLDLSSNKFQGNVPIPPYGTKFFSVSDNELTGAISYAICNVTSLIVLNLSHNKLTGLIPQCLVALSNLSVLDLQVNNLVGSIPRNFSERSLLQTLHFNSNQLNGPLPLSLAHCKQLEILDFGDNMIEDTFPSWLEDLQELQVLVLRANKFHGTVSRLNTTEHPFPKLRIFDVSNNHFNGSLPTSYIKEFKGMIKVNDDAVGIPYMRNDNFSSYEDSVKVTMKGIDIELKRILTTFTTIDLSNNKFEGKIPFVIGKLYSLKGLNLSHNRIIGGIPQSLGNLTNLEWLDLSSNKLTGKIPRALVDLNFLSFLNLSQNQLEGIIPEGKQFNTFLNNSYEGNSGLCGFPLSKTCGKEEGEWPPSSSTFDHDEEFGFGWKPVALGYGCGMLFGVILGCIVFSIGRPQCLARIVEEPNKRAKRTRNRGHANRRRMN